MSVVIWMFIVGSLSVTGRNAQIAMIVVIVKLPVVPLWLSIICVIRFRSITSSFSLLRWMSVVCSLWPWVIRWTSITSFFSLLRWMPAVCFLWPCVIRWRSITSFFSLLRWMPTVCSFWPWRRFWIATSLKCWVVRLLSKSRINEFINYCLNRVGWIIYYGKPKLLNQAEKKYIGRDLREFYSPYTRDYNLAIPL